MNLVGRIFKSEIEVNDYRIIKDETYGYWRVDPLPSEEEIDAFYAKYFEVTVANDPTMSDKSSGVDPYYLRCYQDRLTDIEKYLSVGSEKSILDIGAGYGDFLRCSQKLGWKTSGLEPSKQVCDSIDDLVSLGIKCGSVTKIDDLNLLPSSVITINNVLEHLREPTAILNRLRAKYLLPNGLIYIEVPNDFSPLQEMMLKTTLRNNTKNHYHWCCPPEHLNYWSVETLTRYLEGLGFKIEFCKTTFPLELFVLMGDDYISNPQLGKLIHQKRITLEKNLDQAEISDFKDQLFRHFGQLGIGRNIQMIVSEKK